MHKNRGKVRSQRWLKRKGNLIIINLSEEEGVKGEPTRRPTPDPMYWEKLSKLHPTDVCARSEAIYHPSRDGFVLPVYHQRYIILPKDQRILRVEWDEQGVEEEIPFFFSLMVLVYLIEAKEIQVSHTWVSEKDLKGGSTFFRGPHRLQVDDLEGIYGRDPEGFLGAGRKLGGSEILYGDKGFSLDVFPKVPLAYVLWQGADEFPPRISILLDATVEAHLPLDIIWCMVAATSRRMMGSP